MKWVGMKNPNLQIMIHGKGVGNGDAYTINYPGVKLIKVNKVENKNYVFLDVHISSFAKPGTLKIEVREKTKFGKYHKI